MSFSFIKPEPRPIFSIFTKVWMILISFLFVFLFLSNLFILYKNYSIKSDTNSLKQQQIDLNMNIESMNSMIDNLNSKIEVGKDIQTSNSLLKQSLHNLFDLVPDSITLEEVMMDKTSLIIRGITPTKNVFNQLLSTPLKSIFNTSNTSFYQIKNGWYGFVSTNKMDNSEGYNE
ncbi:hypothetical protein CPIN18021_1302 [Campylobacter pinnipediorum subsp. caledonicus]|uniref:Uncharacterized protein n=1 Tax=Campylobacter pinnipediorum subsp. caledonicus TaxID=1874362 RepID=A0A1S6U8N0_9BACT|nr:hypothetical protein [Campylobacter pinnipediorum]AQW86444.1 hypothetical protein CPIN18020_1253 [Campylobacter pinnipediorum subsp. caledonicus]AQW88096.1 hypothetical protein CPIN18021_1302 [Campylobacter pinnipediorum subsp. caledonicus]OPA71539.1 hypothetical protein BB381_03330 [Campylobacter pinnipediorum subsp. caledonicus]